MTGGPPRAAGFVTGGSSGIGLEIARLLSGRGQNVAIFARDPARLVAVSDQLTHAAPPGTQVRGFACDVADADGFRGALDAAYAQFGAPSHAIASAGVATPGLFTEQSPQMRARHMAVNYQGAVTFVEGVVPWMRGQGGHIGLISSAASYFGIYGYSAYAPSKFALRALAEVLTLEMAHEGISVTHIAPPDTDTPMLAAEALSRPAATAEITGAGGLWAPQAVARAALRAMDKGRPDAPIGAQAKALARLASVLAPLLRHWQARVVKRHDGT